MNEALNDEHEDSVKDEGETVNILSINHDNSQRCTNAKTFGNFQNYATQKSMLVILCTLQTLIFFAQNGLISMSVSTIEKRFELQSTETGYIISIYDFIAAPVFLIVAVLGDRVKRKPFWMSIGIVVCSCGCFVYMLPHFIIPGYNINGKEVEVACNNNVTHTEDSCSDNWLRNYRFIFMLAVALFSIGSNPFYVYAMSYIDENVKKADSALYTGIFNSFSGVGTAMGYIVGGATLNIFTNPSESVPIKSGSELWIGAWWIGFIICGVLLAFTALPMALFPQYISGTNQFRQNRSDEVHRSVARKKNKSKQGLYYNIQPLSRNLPFIFLTLGSAVNFSLIFGFNTFGAKYIETMFGMNPFYSALMFGICAVFAAAGAQFLGGFIISKYELSVAGITKFIIMCALVSALCCMGFLIHCSDEKFTGGTIPYTNQSSQPPLSLWFTCNQNCHCSTNHYYPVCGDDNQMYFSPCFAGCPNQVNNVYYNCSCIDTLTKTATRNKCPSSFCYMLPVFLIIVFLCFMTSIITDTPANQITLRCVPFSQRVTAFSMQKVIVHLFGVIPGRVIAGKVVDLSCIVWSTECDQQGACKSYNRQQLARNTTALLFVETLIVLTCYILVHFTYQPTTDNTEEDVAQENNICNEIQETNI